MVLRIAVLALLAGCSQSLFDQHPGGGGGGGGGDDDGSGSGITSTCPQPCLADAGGDFGMSGKNWRYVEDTRNRAWVAMTSQGTTEVGTDDPMNAITTCADDGGAEACGTLPGALLVSSSGSTSVADPAIEWTSQQSQTIAFALGVYIPTGATTQTIRFYRNSREDTLATLTANPGTTATANVTLDAVAGDRFLVAVAPIGTGDTDVGVQLFATGSSATFPQTCELALTFGNTSGSMAANACGSPFAGMADDGEGDDSPHVITLGPGPFPEQGSAAAFAANDFIVGADILDRSGDTTTQFWVQHGAVVPDYGAWVFSDYDLNSGGGLGFDIYENDAGTGLELDTGTCTDASSTPIGFAIATSTYPNDGAWHFVRAVHTNGTVSVCIDGKMTASVPVAAGGLQTGFPVYDGKNVEWTPVGAFFNGALDDLRSFKTALPCGN